MALVRLSNTCRANVFVFLIIDVSKTRSLFTMWHGCEYFVRQVQRKTSPQRNREDLFCVCEMF